MEREIVICWLYLPGGRRGYTRDKTVFVSTGHRNHQSESFVVWTVAEGWRRGIVRSVVRVGEMVWNGDNWQTSRVTGRTGYSTEQYVLERRGMI